MNTFVVDEETQKRLIKEAIREWLDDKYAGKWTITPSVHRVS